MTLRRVSIVCLLTLLLAVTATASGEQKSQSGLIRLSKQNRIAIDRAFTSDPVYTRTAFPMGITGLRIVNGQVTPNSAALQQVIDTYGPAVQRGDLVRITNINIKEDHIHFEINGGPAKGSKWYQKVTVYGPGGTPVPIKPKKPDADVAATPHGSFVDLYFENPVYDLSASCLKELLRPVFDFAAKSSLEAYLDTVPREIQQAVKNHRVLVGMNREMLLHAKGLPARKIHENDGDNEYEEWIYGDPPRDVEFVRITNNEVIRVETMKVNGDKIVRTEKEVVAPASTDSQNNANNTAEPDGSPTQPPSSGGPCSGKPSSEPVSAAPVSSIERFQGKTETLSSNCPFK